MNLLSVQNIKKSFGTKVLFKDISFGIEEGERLGFIGVNGTGKSTLLKILSGIMEPDEGSVVKGKNVTIGYLPQSPEFDGNLTVLEQIFSSPVPEIRLLREYEKNLIELNLDPDNAALQNSLAELSARIDTLGVWDMENEAKNILNKLGITKYDTLVGTLSGGERKRIAMAQILITPSDILILDEPTNHIDNSTVEWLEEYLGKRKGSLILVTHDRYFLDRVVNRVIELDNGNLYSYTGNYTHFLEAKLEREQVMEANERSRQNLLRRELEWVKRGAKARTTKQKARLDRYEELKNQDGLVKTERTDLSNINTGSRLGNKVIELTAVTKSFGPRTLIKDFTYLFGKDDRLGIIGPNGAGKSTLIKLITGELSPDSGQVDIGETVNFGYYSQENQEMNPELRVIEYIKETAEVYTSREGIRLSASKMLETFLFTPESQWSPIAKLSGGEKRRLYLLSVLMSNPNVLILDEPTNDLDVQTLTILEDFLDGFGGTVITVSHDRYFLDRTVDKLLSFEGDGVITHYTGNYSDYLEYKKNNVQAAPNTVSSESETKSKPTQYRDNSKEKPLKFSYKEQKEFDEIEGIIESIENEISEVNKKIEGAGSDYVLLEELTRKGQELEALLNEKLERWEYLNELAEKIENNRNK